MTSLYSHIARFSFLRLKRIAIKKTLVNYSSHYHFIVFVIFNVEEILSVAFFLEGKYLLNYLLIMKVLIKLLRLFSQFACYKLND